MPMLWGVLFKCNGPINFNKLVSKSNFPWLFSILIFSSLDLFFWATDMASYRLGTLPFLIPLFGGLFWETLKRGQSLMLALLFCWVGDVLLLHDTNHLLQILSVSSYLMAQFLFIDVLLKRINVFSGSSFFMGILFFGAYLIIFFSHIYSYLEDIKFIGLAYGFTLSFLGCLSIMRFFQHQTWKRFSLFLGVLLFSGRDVMLTYNKYFFDYDYFILGIGLTYPIALFFILAYFRQSNQLKSEP